MLSKKHQTDETDETNEASMIKERMATLILTLNFNYLLIAFPRYLCLKEACAAV